MHASNSIAVFIADDHLVVRQGIKTLLDGSEIEIVGEATNGTELTQQLLIDQVPLDVLLLDLNMPDLDPVTFVQQLKATRPKVNILAITGAPDARKIEVLMRNGLQGYLLKTATSDLLEPIRVVAQGDYYLSSEAQQLLFEFQRHNNPVIDPPTPLSERDKQLLVLIAQGYNNDEIAKRLHVGRGTVNNYISRLYSTIGVENRSQATTYAIKHGLLRLEASED
jgi:DNA-binding NarL/FixJ family response regulator